MSIVNDVVPILANPAAGGGRSLRAALAAANRLREHGVASEIRSAAAPGEIEWQTRELAATGAERVLVCGGDGTMHEAVNGLAGTRTVLGVIPAGRGNDFAAAVGVRSDVRTAVDVFLDGRVRAVDVGVVNGRRFGTSLASGLDADVALRTRSGLWRHAGRPGYVACAVLRLLTYRAPLFTLTGDFGRRMSRYLICAVSNTGTYGGGVPIAPGSSVDDGQLDVCLVRDVPLRRAFRLIPKILAGQHTDANEVELFRTTTLEITSPDAVPAVADGEPAGVTPVRIAVEPGALRVMAPA